MRGKSVFECSTSQVIFFRKDGSVLEKNFDVKLNPNDRDSMLKNLLNHLKVIEKPQSEANAELI